MYLPSFYKMKFEKYAFNVKRAAPFALPIGLWLTWCMWPSIYNTIYTDFIPPSRGVTRRQHTE